MFEPLDELDQFRDFRQKCEDEGRDWLGEIRRKILIAQLPEPKTMQELAEFERIIKAARNWS